MNRLKFSIRRTTAVFLAVLMTVSALNGAFLVGALPTAKEVKTVTSAELIAKEYAGQLSDAEIQLLKSGMLSDTVYTYTVPGDDDGLVTVDAEKKQISASSYTDSYNNIWKPDGASVVYTEDGAESTERVELNSDGDAFNGTFAYAGNAYSVQVKYVLKTSVSSDEQKALLESAAALKNGVDNLDALNSPDITSTLATLETYLYELKRLVDGVDVTIPGSSATINMKIVDEGFVKGVTSLDNQKEANGGHFDLTVLLNDYSKAQSKNEYLVNHASEVRAAAEKTYEDLIGIYTYKQSIENYESLMNQLGFDNQLASIAFNSIKITTDAIKPVIDADWSVTAGTALRDDLSAAQYKVLDTVIEKIETTVDLDGFAYADTFTADEDVITVNQNRHDVSVTVSAEVVSPVLADTSDTVKLAPYSATVTVADGASAEDVLTAVTESGIENQALAGWNSENALYSIDPENYVRSSSELSGVLSEDIEYNISYSPKSFEITCDGEYGIPASVPFGYNITLPSYEDDTQVYEYIVNGAEYLQGDIFRVTGNTEITRKQDKPKTEYEINKIAASLIGNDEAATVLNSSALLGEKISLRTPDGDLVKVEWADGNYKVTAATYNAAFNGLLWIPINGIVKTENGSIVETFDITSNGSAYVGTFNSSVFDHVEVNYRLDLNGIIGGETLLKTMNLPYVLTTEASQLKDQLAILNNQYSNMAQLKDQASTIRMAIRGAEDGALTDAIKEAGLDLVDRCFNPDTGNLYAYDYMTEYRAGGLGWYYKQDQSGAFVNYDKMNAQLAVLKRDLPVLCDEDGVFKAFLDGVKTPGGNSAGKYYTVLEDMVEAISALDLVKPNTSVNGAGEELSGLIRAIENAIGKTQEITSVEGYDVFLNAVMIGSAPGRAVVKITVKVQNAQGTVISENSLTSPSIQVGELTSADAAVLNDLFASLEAGVDGHYELSASSDKMLEAGYELRGNENLTFIYVPKTYNVHFISPDGAAVDGVSDTVISYSGNVQLNLTACREAGYRYDYIIGGERVRVMSDMTYSVGDKFDSLFENGETTIVVEKVYVARENFLNMVDKLNRSVSDMTFASGGHNCLTAAFIPVEDSDGNMSVVLRVAPQKSMDPADLAKGIMQTVISAGYNNVSVGGSTLYSGSEDKIYLQAVVDMLLNSGMGLKTIAEAVDENGRINEMSIDGDVAFALDNMGGFAPTGNSYVNNAETYGGKLLESTLGLDGVNVALYVTIEDFGLSTSTLSKLRSSVEKLRSYVDVTFENGEAVASVRIPDKAYQAYLAAMLVTGNSELAEACEPDIGKSVEYIYNLLLPILTDTDVTVDTYQNTLAMLGVHKDITSAARIYTTLQKILIHVIDNATVKGGSVGSTYTAECAYSPAALIDSLGVGSLKGAIAEAADGAAIKANLRATLQNRDSSYEAIVIDPHAAGIKNKAGFTGDVKSALAKVGDNSIVILTSDVTGDLTCDKTVYIDLNGHNLDGNITGAGITLVDSTFANNGRISGNVSIKRDARTNDYYFLTVEGNEVRVNIKADILNRDAFGGLKTLAFDLAFDLALNYYTSAALSVDGNEIYNTDKVQDLVDLYVNGRNAATVNELLDVINCEGLTAFANSMIAKLTDFGTMAQKAERGNALCTFDVSTSAWDLKLYRAEADYVTADIAPSAERGKNQTIGIYLAGEENDVKAATKLLAALGDVLDMSAEVAFESIDYADKNVNIKAVGKAAARFDLTDPDYAVLFAAVVAYGSEDAVRTALTDGIKAYYSENSTDVLHEAVNELTTAQVIGALRKFNSGSDIAQMMADLGLGDIVGDSAIEMMGTYRSVINAMCYLIRRADVNGNDAKLGSRESSETYGLYNLIDKSDINRTGSKKIYNSYGIGYDLTVESLLLDVRLFTDEKPEEFAITVIDSEGVTHNTNDPSEAFAYAANGGMIIFNKDIVLSENVTINSSIVMNGAYRLAFTNDAKLLISENGELVSDGDISGNTAALNPDYYELKSEELADGKVRYTVSLYDIIVTKDGSDKPLYAGHSLKDAFAAAADNDGSVITLNGTAVLDGNVSINNSVTVKGADKISFADNAKILIGADGALTTDADVTVSVAPLDTAYYDLKCESSADGTFRYTVSLYDIIVTAAGSDTPLYAGYSLKDAFAAADIVSDSTITLNGDAALEEKVLVNNRVIISGADKITFTNGAALMIGGSGAIISDSDIGSNVALEDSVNYSLLAEKLGDRYIYCAELYAIVVTNDGSVRYRGDNLKRALNLASAGSTVRVNSAVTWNCEGAVDERYLLDREITLIGADNISLRDGTYYSLTVDGSLISDREFSAGVDVRSQSKYSSVTKIFDNGFFKYKLAPIDPVLTGAAPTVNTSSSVIYGAKVDNVNRYIYLDVQSSGITEAQFAALVSFSGAADNASHIDVKIDEGGLAENNNRYTIRNGATVTVTAQNPDSSVAPSVKYTVIIMGDTNCNGMTDAGDCRAIQYHVLGMELLKDASLLAADINGQSSELTGSVDTGDARVNQFKILNGSEYKSALK